jgi:hypothetical protein
MIRFRSFDLSLRTTYAQAKELALAQEQVPLLTAGSIQAEQRAGGQFVYRYRYDAVGKRIVEYLGPRGDEKTTAKVERARQEIQDQEALASYSQSLRKIGFYSADNSTVVTVASLFNAGVFGKGAVLIGTHAFGILLNELGVSAVPFPLTEDVDVARARRIEIAALPEGGLLTLLKQTGLPFHEVPGLKRGEPPTSFKVRGRKLKVDLLVPSDRTPYRAVQVPELGAYATGLPFLGYLLEDAAMSVLIGRDRVVPVAVPHAGRFCVHKFALQRLRGQSDEPKREKDMFQAVTLAAILAREQDFSLRDAIDAMNKPLRMRARPAAVRAIKILKEDHPAAAQMLESLA